MTTISKPSVQSLLICLNAGSERLATGTAFVCESKEGPALITNWHNVAGRNPSTKTLLSPSGLEPDNVDIVHNQADQLGRWVVRNEALKSHSKPIWIEHPTLGGKADLVALPLVNLDGVALYPYALKGDPPIAINPAESVSVVGFPFGIQAGGSLAVWATGFVASEPSIDFGDLPVFLVDCRSRPGQSGSAVIAHRNGGAVTLENGNTAIFGGPVTRLLGIYSGRINQESDLGIVLKMSAIEESINSI